jgi:NAD kinase
MLALTPISPFRPRRWRGAILPDQREITFRVLEPEKRPVAAVADQKEVRDIVEVQVKVAREQELTLLFDRARAAWKSASSPNSSRSEPRLAAQRLAKRTGAVIGAPLSGQPEHAPR